MTEYGMNLIDKAILKIIQRRVSHWFDRERSLAKDHKNFGATEDSPEKTWPDPHKIPLDGEVSFSLKNFFIVGRYRLLSQEIKQCITIRMN